MGFDANGHLPVGDHTMTLAALRRSPLVTGPPNSGPAWDEAWNLLRRLPDAHGKLKPLMWHKYRVELFPHYLPPFESQAVGITAASGRPILFPDLFRMTREGTPRGIVRIVTPQPP